MDDLVVNCVELLVRINGRQSYRTFRIILVGDQLEGMKAIKQCTCNRRLLISMKVQIGINLTDNNKIEREQLL